MDCCGGRSNKEEVFDAEIKKPAKALEHKHFSFNGMFAPVDKEVFVPDLSVEGQIPADLCGEYVRNGPNRLWDMPSSECQWHWFFGDGMVHGVRLDKGKASYHNHFLRTGKFVAEQKKGGPLREAVVFSTTWWKFLLALGGEKLGLVGGYPDNQGYNNTSMVYHNSRAQALCEADYPLEMKITLDGHLESAARYLYVKEGMTMNAHPKVDPSTGELFCMNYSTTGSPTFSYGVVSPGGEVTSKCTGRIGGGKAVMIHDCGITEKYALVLDCPVLTDITFLDTEGCIWKYDADNGARIGIFPRDVPSGNISDEAIKWFTIETGYIFHIANCWQEDEQTVVMIAVRWDSINMNGFNTTPLFDASGTHMRRWTFHLDTGAVEEEPVVKDSAPAKIEFPVIHPQYVGRKCRWSWAAGSSAGEPAFHHVFKYDLQKGAITGSIDFERGGRKLSAGECSFVPRVGGSSEDDGYLVTFVVDPDGGNPSSFWVMDASSMNSAPLAVVSLPARVPLGFHGIWVDEDCLHKQCDAVTLAAA